MRWSLNLKLSVRAIARSRARTALSAGAVGVGIASTAVLIGAGVGAERALQEALEKLGRNLLVVNAARTRTSPLRGTSRVSTTLTVADWEAIALEAPGVEASAPVAEARLGVQAGGRTVAARVTGTTAAFAGVRGFPLVAGRFIDEDDVRDRRRVAVVGADVVADLFFGESPLGETVRVRGVPFSVVGVMKKKGVSVDGANEDDLVVIPFTAAMRRLLDVEWLDRVYVQTASEAALPAARASIEAILRARHATAGGPDDFGIQDQTAMVRARRQAGGLLSQVVKGLSATACGLGGVGLMVVSLLSVRERYREIGLRLAVGGRPRDILMQFVAEAVMIAALGGAAGIAVGAAGCAAGAALTRWPMAIGWQTVVYPALICLGIALVFGAWPAYRASRCDPVRALSPDA